MTISRLPAVNVTVALLMAFTTGTQAEPSEYLCVATAAAGLAYNKETNVWGPAPFAPGKWVLRKINDDDRDHQKGKWWTIFDHDPEANWAFFEFGKADPMPLLTCHEGTGGYSSEFSCRQNWSVFDGSFDKDSRRFELISRGAYIQQGRAEQFRREHPDYYARSLKEGRVPDPSGFDRLWIAIGTCSPS
jgi:hypothetical protein